MFCLLLLNYYEIFHMLEANFRSVERLRCSLFCRVSYGWMIQMQMLENGILNLTEIMKELLRSVQFDFYNKARTIVN